jgi:uroporphyrinogen-III synthase
MAKARLIEAAGPLAGASVIVTRPAASSAALRQRIRALGGNAIGLPGLSLRASDDITAAKAALAAVRSADLAIFVSPAAVKFAFVLRPTLRFSRATRICAIGAATARALARRGLRDAVFPHARQDSESLLALPELQRLRGKRVAVIAAPGGRELLMQTLRARRARVLHAHVYQRVAPRYTARQLALLEQAASPLLTLLSSAEVLANLRAKLPLLLFARLAAGELIVSSERLAQLARRSLFANVHVAASAAPRDLLHTAQQALARHRL